MYGLEKDGKTVISKDVPDYYKGIEGLKNASEEKLNSLGIYPYVKPEIDTDKQTLLPVYFDEESNIFTHKVITKTPNAIRKTKEDCSEKIRSEKQLALETMGVGDKDWQKEHNKAVQLVNIDMFPMWSEEDVFYKERFKVKAFNGIFLKLYRCTEDHESSYKTNPEFSDLWEEVKQ